MHRFAVLFVLVASMVGCAKPAPPTPPADALVGIATFKLDADEHLRRSCQTAALEDCDVVKALERAEQSLRALHANQVREQRALLARLLDLLEREDETPVLRLTEKSLRPETWPSADAQTTGTLEVRTEVPRGTTAMGPGTLADLKALLKEIKALKASHDRAFDALLKAAPKAFQPPADLANARGDRQIVVNIEEGSAKLELMAAAFENQSFNPVAPWVAVVSFVVSKDGLPYSEVASNRIAIPPALEAALYPAGLVINERREAAGKASVSSTFDVRHVCDTLRGEVRFVRADETLQRQASFVRVGSEGGN